MSLCCCLSCFYVLPLKCLPKMQNCRLYLEFFSSWPENTFLLVVYSVFQILISFWFSGVLVKQSALQGCQISAFSLICVFGSAFFLMESGWSRIDSCVYVFSTNFFLRDFLSIIFKILLQSVFKLTSRLSASTGRPTNIRTARLQCSSILLMTNTGKFPDAMVHNISCHCDLLQCTHCILEHA